MFEDPRRYLRLANELQARIEDGQIKPGDRLSIRALAAQSGYCPGTVSHALKVLEDCGRVRRHPGSRYVVTGDSTDLPVARGIRRFRTERGMPMREMASLLGVHVSTISRIEAGEVAISKDARTIAALLGVSVIDLLRDCPHCGYQPPGGYQCLRCGTPGSPAPGARG